MSRPNRVNNQFYRKLKLGKSFREVISHFRRIKQYMMAENDKRSSNVQKEE